MKCYLSGPIYANNVEGTVAWRDTATKLLHGQTIDPCRGRAIFDPSIFTTKEIVSRDKLDIRNSDIVLVYGNLLGDHLGIGTWCEMEYAHSLGKPIVIVSSDERVMRHPWTNEYRSQMFRSVEAACEYITNFWTEQ